MAQNNVLVYSEHLFARKGEAAPAGRAGSNSGHGCFSPFPHNDLKQQNSKKRKSGERGASPLSSLIQRRPHAPENPGGAEKITVVSENEVYESWRKLKSRLETPRESEHKEQWKKLTFRVRYDQYVRLKNLSGLWSTTYQSILEKAVAYYIDEATTSEGSD